MKFTLSIIPGFTRSQQNTKSIIRSEIAACGITVIYRIITAISKEVIVENVKTNTSAFLNDISQPAACENSPNTI